MVTGIAGMGLAMTLQALLGSAVGRPGAGFVVIVLMFMTMFAAPGAFVLGLPLTSFLRFVSVNVPGLKTFLAVAMAAGAGLGVVNLVLGILLASLAFQKGLNLSGGDLGEWAGPALGGGVGLGLGSALSVWQDRKPPRTPGEWRGAC
jgi:hypothetical protein